MTTPTLRSSLVAVIALAALAAVAGPAAATVAGSPAVRVLDESGRPIPGAKVSFAWFDPRGNPVVKRRILVPSDLNGGVEEDELETIDRRTSSAGLAVCDSCTNRVGSYQAIVSADGYRSANVEHLPTGAVAVVRLGPEARIHGRVTRDGHPVVGARVTMEGGIEVRADSAGAYVFADLVPHSSYLVYTPMDHGSSAGATRAVYVVTGSARTNTEATQLRAGPTHVLRGRLVPPAGTKLPDRTLLFWERTITSQRGGDAYIERPYVKVFPDGRFEIPGLPEQPMRLSLDYTNWKFGTNPPAPFRRSADGMMLLWDVRVDLDGVDLPVRYEPPPPEPFPESMP